MINLNIFAKEIAEAEGLKEEVNIAQIKEVIKLTLIGLGWETPEEVLKVIAKTYEKHHGLHPWID